MGQTYKFSYNIFWLSAKLLSMFFLFGSMQGTKSNFTKSWYIWIDKHFSEFYYFWEKISRILGVYIYNNRVMQKVMGVWVKHINQPYQKYLLKILGYKLSIYVLIYSFNVLNITFHRKLYKFIIFLLLVDSYISKDSTKIRKLLYIIHLHLTCHAWTTRFGQQKNSLMFIALKKS